MRRRPGFNYRQLKAALERNDMYAIVAATQPPLFPIPATKAGAHRQAPAPTTETTQHAIVRRPRHPSRALREPAD